MRLPFLSQRKVNSGALPAGPNIATLPPASVAYVQLPAAGARSAQLATGAAGGGAARGGGGTGRGCGGGAGGLTHPATTKGMSKAIGNFDMRLSYFEHVVGFKPHYAPHRRMRGTLRGIVTPRTKVVAHPSSAAQALR